MELEKLGLIVGFLLLILGVTLALTLKSENFKSREFKIRKNEENKGVLALIIVALAMVIIVKMSNYC